MGIVQLDTFAQLRVLRKHASQREAPVTGSGDAVGRPSAGSFVLRDPGTNGLLFGRNDGQSSSAHGLGLHTVACRRFRLMEWIMRMRYMSSREGTENDRRCSWRIDEGEMASRRTSALFWVRLSLGAIFVVASVDKIIHPKAFADIIHNYQILPDTLINIIAITLPWLELMLGMLLISGLWLPGVVILTNILLLGFFLSLLFNVARGLDVHCGCFTTSGGGKSAMSWNILRDAVFLFLGGYLFFRVFPREKRRHNKLLQ